MTSLPLVILGILAAIAVGVLLIVFLIVPLFKGIGWLLRQLFRFVTGEVGDALRLVGSVITFLFISLLTVLNVIIGRWSAATHFGRGVTREVQTMGKCIYRMCIGHPAQLLCLGGLTEGIEKRLPEIVAQAPGPDAPTKRTGQFDGYRIVGSLHAGGSGAKLYIAEPDAIKLQAFARNGVTDCRSVVIKSFSLNDGGSLPNIVRESRALDAAKRLGLILDNELSDERFFYVMRYVPGDSLSVAGKQLHGLSGSAGLGNSQLKTALGYMADLLSTLEHYHVGGLWHKDVKPDNIIVDGHRAHLVDFGLVTPLRSAMTLTTHGTEYFRDPEMVRMALKGVKVHEVDGTKFDIFGAGAVLFSLIEDSFPAHGVLSPVNKRCPEAVRWIIRRAMTEYDKRYASAGEMLADLRVVMLAPDPFSLRPVDLPSVQAGGSEEASEQRPHEQPSTGIPASIAAAAAVGMPPIPNAPTPAMAQAKPNIRVVNWWTGRSEVDDTETKTAPVTRNVAQSHKGFNFSPTPISSVWSAKREPRIPIGHDGRRLTASEQLERARGRVKSAMERAQSRVNRRSTNPNRTYSNSPAAGIAIAVGAVSVLVFFILGGSLLTTRRQSVVVNPPTQPMFGPLAIEIDSPTVPTALTPPSAPVYYTSSKDPSRTKNSASNSADKVGGPIPTSQVAERGSTLPTGSVLIISDFDSTLPADSVRVIKAATSALRNSGLSLIGVPFESGVSDEQSAQENEIVALFRKDVGLVSPDASNARQAISTWLASHSDSARAVLWMTPSLSGAKDGIVFRVFGEDGDANSAALAQAVRNAIPTTTTRR